MFSGGSDQSQYSMLPLLRRVPRLLPPIVQRPQCIFHNHIILLQRGSHSHKYQFIHLFPKVQSWRMFFRYGFWWVKHGVFLYGFWWVKHDVFSYGFWWVLMGGAWCFFGMGFDGFWWVDHYVFLYGFWWVKHDAVWCLLLLFSDRDGFWEELKENSSTSECIIMASLCNVNETSLMSQIPNAWLDAVWDKGNKTFDIGFITNQSAPVVWVSAFPVKNLHFSLNIYRLVQRLSVQRTHLHVSVSALHHWKMLHQWPLQSDRKLHAESLGNLSPPSTTVTRTLCFCSDVFGLI